MKKRFLYRSSRTFIVLFQVVIVAKLVLGATLNNSASWREEALQFDGSRVVLQRSLSYGGRHELGQSSPIREQTIKFILPHSGKLVKWTSEFSKDIGRSNFNLLAVHILNDTPYIVAAPNLCLSYNKWGRPNPPYVIFRYDGSTWQRISMNEFPVEFETINVALTPKIHERKLIGQGMVSAEIVEQLNRDLKQPYLQSIIRTPLDPGAIGVSCSEMIRVNDGWVGIEWFSSQSSCEQCQKVCNIKKMNEKQCPCNRLYGKNNQENYGP